MSKRESNSSAEKISVPFRARLDKLGRKKTTRAIVLIRKPDHGKVPGRRQSREERTATVEAVQNAAAAAVGELDQILNQHDGKRLADRPNALGCIPIEATRQGVLAVAESDLVEAVLEDQAVSVLR